MTTAGYARKLVVPAPKRAGPEGCRISPEIGRNRTACCMQHRSRFAHTNLTVMVRDLLAELDRSTIEFAETLTQFSARQLNAVPASGGWTAGQVAEHILLSESGVPELLHGPTVETMRKPDEKVATIKSIFLNFDMKMSSPEMILPSENEKNLLIQVSSFLQTRKAIRHAIATLDFSHSCTAFPFPELGVFTRWEWACFVICHARRHTRQMQQIYEILNG